MLLFDETATTGIYTYCHTLSLHDALPSSRCSRHSGRRRWQTHCLAPHPHAGSSVMRSDISHLPVKNQREQIGRAHVCTPVTNAHLVCRLLFEKKNTI